jgi:predicted HAD superfamily Cof-like phosphohydrolase
MWHKRARPNPTDKDFNVQLGCHFEEIAEMLDALSSASFNCADDLNAAAEAVSQLSMNLKRGAYEVAIHSREELLDSLADQIVTAVGVGHCAGMKTSDACVAVNSSNWSKFSENGHPLFDENGKVKKGPNYHKPDLEGMY